MSMALIEDLYEILENPSSVLGLSTEMVIFVGPLWIAFLIGLMVGWSWKPRLVSKLLDSSLPSSPCRSFMSQLKSFASFSPWNSLVVRSSNWESPLVMDNSLDKNIPSIPPTEFEDCSISHLNEERSSVASLVSEEDLERLYQLAEEKDGGPTWIRMMDRSTPTMGYQAWRRDPKYGPLQYRSRSVFEDVSPEIARDFFWDDEFRAKWDDMLAHSAIIDECPTTGTMLVQWIRKFPLFCGDREYIIGRRIWESGRSFYCVTKGVPCSSVPRQDKPRRVDLYYSSWHIRAVESRTGDGQLTACEVTFFHHEDMGIPWEIAKLGVRQLMWGTVKKIEPGLRAYQKARASGAALSRSAFMAQINTKINSEFLRSLGDDEDLSDTAVAPTSDEPLGRNIPKVLIFGGAIVLACSINRGLLTKAFIFSVGRRFGNIGKRVQN